MIAPETDMYISAYSPTNYNISPSTDSPTVPPPRTHTLTLKDTFVLIIKYCYQFERTLR